jgi:cytohesin
VDAASNEDTVEFLREHGDREFLNILNIKKQQSMSSINIHDAAKNADLGAVKALITNTANVDAKDSAGRTPLHIAVIYDNADVAELLLAKGANVNAKNNDALTPLHAFAMTPTLGVAMVGKGTVADILISKGADINARGRNGNTPLHLAAYAGNNDVAKYLFANGADVNSKDDEGATPLLKALSGFAAGYLAIMGGGDKSLLQLQLRTRKEVAEFLIANGADVNEKKADGTSPLMCVSQLRAIAELMPSSGAVECGDKDLADILRAHGAHE